jgi:hypothetical protein
MKISCPSCGNTYTLPPELIVRIVKEHQNRQSVQPAPPKEPIFIPAPTPPEIAPRRRSLAKRLMLIVTIFWPIGVGILWFSEFGNVTKGTYMGGGFYVVDGHNFISRDALISQVFVSSLIQGSVAWGLAIAFLAVIWFATRR